MEYLLYAIAVLLTLAFMAFTFYPYFKLKASRGKTAPTLNDVLTTGPIFTGSNKHLKRGSVFASTGFMSLLELGFQHFQDILA